ncbi:MULTISPECIES: DNA recombination protein RmuC [Hydrogenophaga]|jgi:DNA recombination protein RmuC|uniref:DNA recombination protein n=1 Tax=Hydrogenophaga intermedia TaxID=65786 RepID=A0A1L1PRC6_HYDIT|nr:MULTISPECIES: DNA recombination protein RmuC [Hydrogenophaga]AOS78990.1 recombinase RmuC [Hydrogenophaga sp. PBC]TMU74521.1 DNA recombination protein RmuC [Hydrogenophaga intermedia]CDN87895.1 DNA recombination protein [Hydrogenophaga intermedia]
MDTWLLIVLLALAVAGVLLQVLLWRRRPEPAPATSEEIAHRQAVLAQLQQITQRVQQVEGELRREVADNARTARQEQQHSLSRFQESITAQSAETTRTQNAQLDGFAQQLVQLRGALGDALTRQLQDMSEANARRLAEIRTTLDAQLTQLQQGNAAKLDEMRAVVDEKLQTTLQARLGESFKQVADRLEQVHKGLGEMQTLAQGVGDLKHLLTNVKTRGMFGEAQLAALLEQVFAPDQYAAQVSTRPGSRNAVDFAVRLPGRGDDGAPCWLPIDAKFPNEDYERLLDAQQRADVEGAEIAARALEQRIRLEAKSMAEKYLEPPHTTDFAILFLPTEGLYAEVLRRPGLMELLQREHRVTLAGPTTLMAMLNSLQMGFRTLALEKRSSEVWQVLGAVKTEFGKFGDTLARVKSQTQTVLNTLDQAEVRSRAMGRALKTVEALPQDRSSALLPLDSDPTDPEAP